MGNTNLVLRELLKHHSLFLDVLLVLVKSCPVHSPSTLRGVTVVLKAALCSIEIISLVKIF
jgi:hypothetical protein